MIDLIFSLVYGLGVAFILHLYATGEEHDFAISFFMSITWPIWLFAILIALLTR